MKMLIPGELYKISTYHSDDVFIVFDDFFNHQKLKIPYIIGFYISTKKVYDLEFKKFLLPPLPLIDQIGFLNHIYYEFLHVQ